MITQWTSQNRRLLRAQWLELTTIPAPSGSEARRAHYLLDKFRSAGLSNTHMDPKGNVIGQRIGNGQGNIVLAPHMDTVFAEDTPLVPKTEGRRIYAPGIRDNTAGLAVTLGYMQAVSALDIILGPTVTVVATVEEEVGLRGMQYFLDNVEFPIDYLIAVDGPLGTIIYGGPGITWLEITLRAKGGHAWTEFGKIGAIQAMADIVSRIYNIRVPKMPKTIYNVGRIEGGTVPNAIAEEARIRVDLRSQDDDKLRKLSAQVQQIATHVANGFSLDHTIEILSDLPAGTIPGGASHPLVQAAVQTLVSLDVPVNLVPCAATDANPANASGIPAIAVGSTTGDNPHSLEEWADADNLLVGVHQLALLTETVSQLLSSSSDSS